jgi:hypothetical protein
MELIIKYLGAGRLEKYPIKPVLSVVIGKLSDITHIIIPFFNQYPIVVVKT